MFNLDQAIAEWRCQLVAAGVKDQELLDELESHLRDDQEQVMRTGASAQEAFATAVEHIGQVGALKREFEASANAKGAPGSNRPWHAFGLVAALAVMGGILCYLLILPLSERSTEQYQLSLGLKAANWQSEERFKFVLRFMSGLVALAMPAVSLFFIKARLMHPRKLATLRPYALVLNLVLAALVTTPEVVTQILMFIPLQLAYELTVLAAVRMERKFG